MVRALAELVQDYDPGGGVSLARMCKFNLHQDWELQKREEGQFVKIKYYVISYISNTVGVCKLVRNLLKTQHLSSLSSH